ncbi:hypothetical protein OQJ26_16045 [Legionella sp. PATHC038]|uniref:hypothetical protein n=1 Tax=Legionella sheltonii TaxID=2992041 RepID=UPI0022432B33|nr:hypothetical protein [Legionella sp. PATHC038]MCW8400294.1 hypothetical protein [Legionella sp. PATHC038]
MNKLLLVPHFILISILFIWNNTIFATTITFSRTHHFMSYNDVGEGISIDLFFIPSPLWGEG